ncbi:MAG TPA: TolC family protein [Xanthobacteraceae bacterium]|jgi:outer membrane protein TolC|nr:TolC family protein [Steroidobacteraceae bacterium]HKS60448.1 TolC family protein [Xanthobacteraceae bacterium]
MTRFSSSIVLMVLTAMASPAVAAAQDAKPLPSPLAIGDVIRIAGERRDEIQAARARTRAGEARPAIVSALSDPMLSPSLDHLPFMLNGADFSVAFEQQIPLSGIRGHRKASSLADVDRLRAEANRTTLDVGIEAANAYLMLQERRRTAALLDEQLTFARSVVSAANARYASGTAPQSDVLRAEVEVARLEATARALVAEVRGAEAMLNTSLALDADTAVPPLSPLTLAQPIPAWSSIRSALTSRPELAVGRAEIARAVADVEVMKDMYSPMATIRTGPSYTMAEGRGWMAMVGISLPIWRGKLKAGVAEAEAMRAMSEADLRAMTRMIEGDAAGAISQLQAARDRQTALTNDVLPRARMAIEPAVASYGAGQLPLVSVIEAIQALWGVQSDLIVADTQLGLAWARLGRAIGSYEAIVK